MLPAPRLNPEELVPNEGGLLTKRPTQESLRKYLDCYFKAARIHLDQQPDWRIPIHPDGVPVFNFFPAGSLNSSNDRVVDKLIQRLSVYYLYTDHDEYLDRLTRLLFVRLLEHAFNSD